MMEIYRKQQEIKVSRGNLQRWRTEENIKKQVQPMGKEKFG